MIDTAFGLGIGGLVTWVWALWKSHNDLRLKLAEEYPKDGAMRTAVAAAIEPLKVAIAEQARTLQHQGRLLEAIARQMHIPAVMDD